MKWKFLGILALTAGFLDACSHRKKEPKASASTSAQWDYERIRETRRAEQAQTPAFPEQDGFTNCTLLTRLQKERSKATGCKPVDARQGEGADSFCCTNE